MLLPVHTSNILHYHRQMHFSSLRYSAKSLLNGVKIKHKTFKDFYHGSLHLINI